MGGDVSVKNVSEGEFVELHGGLLEDVPVSIRLRVSEENDGDGVVTLEFVKSGLVLDLGGDMSDSLLDPGNDLFIGSSSSEINGGSVGEELDGWVSLDGESGSQLWLFSGINLGQGDWLFESLQGGGGSLVFWLELLAVSTPWGIELDQDELVLSDNGVEVGLSQDEDTLILLDVNGEDGQC